MKRLTVCVTLCLCFILSFYKAEDCAAARAQNPLVDAPDFTIGDPFFQRRTRAAGLPDMFAEERNYGFRLKKGTKIPMIVGGLWQGAVFKRTNVHREQEMEYPAYVMYCAQDIYDEADRYVLLPKWTLIPTLWREEKYPDIIKVRLAGIEILTLNKDTQLIAISQHRNSFQKSKVLEKIKRDPRNFIAQDKEEMYIYDYYYENKWLDTIFENSPIIADLIFPIGPGNLADKLQSVDIVETKEGQVEVRLESLYSFDFILMDDLLFTDFVDVTAMRKSAEEHEKRRRRLRQIDEERRERKRRRQNDTVF